MLVLLLTFEVLRKYIIGILILDLRVICRMVTCFRYFLNKKDGLSQT